MAAHDDHGDDGISDSLIRSWSRWKRFVRFKNKQRSRLKDSHSSSSSNSSNYRSRNSNNDKGRKGGLDSLHGWEEAYIDPAGNNSPRSALHHYHYKSLQPNKSSTGWDVHSAPSPRRPKRKMDSSIKKRSVLTIQTAHLAARRLKVISQRLHRRAAAKALIALKEHATMMRLLESEEGQGRVGAGNPIEPKGLDVVSLPTRKLSRLGASLLCVLLRPWILRVKGRAFSRWSRQSLKRSRKMRCLKEALARRRLGLLSRAFLKLALRAPQAHLHEVSNALERTRGVLDDMRKHLDVSSLERRRDLRTMALRLVLRRAMQFDQQFKRVAMARAFSKLQNSASIAKQQQVFSALRSWERSASNERQEAMAEEIETVCTNFAMRQVEKAKREHALVRLLVPMHFCTVSTAFHALRRHALHEKLIIQSSKINALMVSRDLARAGHLHKALCALRFAALNGASRRRSCRALVGLLTRQLAANTRLQAQAGFRMLKLNCLGHSATQERLSKKLKAMARIIRQWERREQSRGLRRWRDQSQTHARLLKDASFLLVSSIMRWRSRKLQAAFTAWSEATVVHHRMAKAKKRTMLHSLSRLLGNSHRLMQVRALRTWYKACITIPVNISRGRRTLRGLLKRWQHRDLSVAFRAWYQACITKPGNITRGRRTLRGLLKRWQHRDLAAAFRTWHWVSGARGRAAQSMGKFVARWGQKQCWRAFAKWRAESSRRSHARVLLRRAASRWRRLKQGQVLSHWSAWNRANGSSTEHLSQGLRAARKMLQRWMKRALMRAFRQWASQTALKVRRSQLVARAARLLRSKDRARAFRKWACIVRGQNQAQRLLTRAGRSIANRSKARAFRKWTRVAQLTLRLQLRLRPLVSRYSRLQRSSAFRHWQAAVAHSKRVETFACKLVNCWTRLRASTAFRTWRKATAGASWHQRALYVIASRWRKLLLAKSWARFHETTSLCARRERLLQQALRRWAKAQKRRGLAQLQWNAVKRGLERTRLRSVLTRWSRMRDRRATLQALSMWKDVLGKSRSKERAVRCLQRTIGAWQNRFLRASFQQWSKAHAAEAWFASVLSRWGSFRVRKSTTAAFLQWRTACARQTRARAALRNLERALARWSRRDLARGFHRWRLRTFALLGQRGFAVRNLARIVRSWARFRHHAAFLRWKENAGLAARQRAYCKTILQRWSKLLQQRAFQQWSRWCTRASGVERGVRAVNRSLMRWRCRAASRALLRWLELAKGESAQRKQLIRVLRIWGRRQLRPAFAQWTAGLSGEDLMRRRLSRVLSIWSRWGLGRAFCRWRDQVAKLQKMQHCLMQMGRKVAAFRKRHALGLLKSASVLQSRKMKTLRRCCRNWGRRMELMCLQKWKSHAIRGAQTKVASRIFATLLNNVVFKRRSRRLLSRAFSKWTCATASSMGDSARVARGAKLMRCFTAWRTLARVQAETRALIPHASGSLRWGRRAVLSRVMTRWTLVVKRRRLVRVRLESSFLRVALWHTRGAYRAAFNKIRDWAILSLRRILRMKNALRLMLYGREKRIGGAFQRWRAHTHGVALCARLVRKWASLRRHRAWNALKQHAFQRTTLRRVVGYRLGLLAHRHSRRALAFAFKRLQERVRRFKTLRSNAAATISTLGRMLSNGRKKHAFQSWLALVRRQRHIRTWISLWGRRSATLVKRAAFRQWSKSISVEKLMRRMCTSFTRHSLTLESFGFSRLRAHAGDCTRRYAALRRMGIISRREEQRIAFRALARWLVVSKKLAKVLRRFAAKTEELRARRAMVFLRRNALRARKLARALDLWRRTQRVSLLRHGMRALSRRCSHCRVLGRILKSWRHRHVYRAFQTLAQRRVSARNAVVVGVFSQAIQRFRLGSKVFAFRKWKSFAADNLRRGILLMRMQIILKRLLTKRSFLRFRALSRCTRAVGRLATILGNCHRQDRLRKGFRAIYSAYWKSHARATVARVVAVLCKSSPGGMKTVLEHQAAAILRVEARFVRVCHGLHAELPSSFSPVADINPAAVKAKASRRGNSNGGKKEKKKRASSLHQTPKLDAPDRYVTLDVGNRNGQSIAQVRIFEPVFAGTGSRERRELKAYLTHIGPVLGFQWMNRVSRSSFLLRRLVHAKVLRTLQPCFQKWRAVGRHHRILSRLFVRAEQRVKGSALMSLYRSCFRQCARERNYASKTLALCRLERMVSHRTAAASQQRASLLLLCANERAEHQLRLRRMVAQHTFAAAWRSKVSAGFAALKENLRKSQAVERLFRQTSAARLKRACWRRWRAECAASKGNKLKALAERSRALRRLLVYLQKYSRRHVLLSGFRALVENHFRTVWLENAGERAAQRVDHARFRFVFFTWRMFTLQASRVRASTLLAVNGKLQSWADRSDSQVTVQRAFTAWSRAARGARQARQDTRRLCFEAWRSQTWGRRTWRTRRTQRLLADSLKHHFFFAWRSAIARRRHAWRTLFRWSRDKGLRMLESAWMKWASFSHDVAVRQQAVVKWARKSRVCRLRAGLQKLRWFASGQALRSTRLFAVLQHYSLDQTTPAWRKAATSRAFFRWRGWSRGVGSLQNHEKLLRGQVLVNRLVARRALTVTLFKRWVGVTQSSRQRDTKVLFQAWRGLTLRARLAKSLSRASGNFARVSAKRRAKRLVFRAWRAHVEHSRLICREITTVQRCVRTSAARRLFPFFFYAWRAYAWRAKMLRKMARHARLRRVVGAWRAYVRAWTGRKKALGALLGKFDSTGASRAEAFYKWSTKSERARASLLQSHSESVAQALSQTILDKENHVINALEEASSKELLLNKVKARANQKIKQLMEESATLRENSDKQVERIEALERSLDEQLRAQQLAEMQLVRSQEENVRLQASAALRLSDLENHETSLAQSRNEQDRLLEYCNELETKVFDMSCALENTERKLEKRNRKVHHLKESLEASRLESEHMGYITTLEKQSLKSAFETLLVAERGEQGSKEQQEDYY